MYKKVCLILLLAFIVGGCYEDTAEITLNPDGSGSIKQKMVLSERLMVASEGEGASASNVPETAKEAVIKKIGSAFEISSITQKDTPDGGRIIELEGTFDTPEQFFLSEYCQEQLNLRLAPADKGKAAVYCDMSQSGDGGPDITQIYGLAKGLYIKRTIQLPAKIEKTNGITEQKPNTVTWSTDLRNKKTLAATKQFVEGPDEGEGFAIFNAAGLDFSAYLKAADIPDKPKPAEKEETPVVSSDSSGLAAKVSWISTNKRMPADGTGIYDMTNLQIGIDLTWEENSCPVSCEKPVLLNIKDDLGNNLIQDSTLSHNQSKISTSEKKRMKKEQTVNAKTPSKEAKMLKQIEGYIETITNTVQEKVVLDNLQALVGKQVTGNAILDGLHFKVESIESTKIKITIDGGNDAIASIAMLKDDRTEIKRSGYSGWENTYTYGFPEDISKVNKCELKVIVSENRVKVPFSLEQIPLP